VFVLYFLYVYLQLSHTLFHLLGNITNNSVTIAVIIAIHGHISASIHSVADMCPMIAAIMTKIINIQAILVLYPRANAIHHTNSANPANNPRNANPNQIPIYCITDQ